MTDTSKDAVERFAEWFRANYPGPDTIIGRPDWHAPKIYRAATHEIAAERDTLAARVAELEAKLATARKACNQARQAFAGQVSAKSAIDMIDALDADASAPEVTVGEAAERIISALRPLIPELIEWTEEEIEWANSDSLFSASLKEVQSALRALAGEKTDDWHHFQFSGAHLAAERDAALLAGVRAGLEAAAELSFNMTENENLVGAIRALDPEAIAKAAQREGGE